MSRIQAGLFTKVTPSEATRCLSLSPADPSLMHRHGTEEHWSTYNRPSPSDKEKQQ